MSKKHKNHRQHDNFIPPYDAAILAEPIAKAGFSEEVVQKLTNGRLNYLSDIVRRTEKDMYKINTFNKKNLMEVKRVLQSKRLDFRPEPELPNAPKQQQQPAPNNGQRQQGRNDAQRPNQQQGKPQHQDRPQQQGRQQPAKAPQNGRPASAPAAHSAPQQGQKGQPMQQRVNQPNRQQPQKQGIKQQNKRIWDPDGISEEKTKEEREKKRPRRQAVEAPRDIYIKINKNDKWGFANRNGKEVVPPIYDEVFTFKEDLCCVEKDNRFGFIDREGNEVIPIEYDCALSFSEGYACVYKNNKCGYINKNNEIVVDFRFDAGTHVIDGSCRVKKDGKWGELFIDNPEEIRWII